MIRFILAGLLCSEKTEKTLDKFNFPFIEMHFPGKMIGFLEMSSHEEIWRHK